MVIKDRGEERRPTETAAALEAEFWAEYLALQQMWRMGEALTLDRWGRGQRAGATRELRQLRQELAALLVGFGE